MNLSKKLCAIVLFFVISVPVFSQNSSFSISFSSTYLEINLNNPVSRNPFITDPRPLDIYRVIEKAADDNKIRGIVLNIGSISRDRDYLWGLRTALEEFKSKDKKIVAYISNADIDTYYLASVADKIVMDELGIIMMLGYSINRGYFYNTLDKIGIGVRELRYFEYKSAAESFTRTSMSEADKKQYNDYLDDIFYVTREALMKSRGWTEHEFDTILNREFLYSAKSAHRRGLVDYVGRGETVKAAIREIEGRSNLSFSIYGDTSSGLTGAIIPYTSKRRKPPFVKYPEIAVVYAEGQTDMVRGIEAVTISREIIKLADINRVKAIIVRLDSPGGSAEAADLINEAIRYAKSKKPVVVSMGSVAASGGYWASMNASHIMASPYTITGSIGVIGNWFYDKGLNEKLGLTSDRLQRGEHADLLTGYLFPYRDLTDLEEERYKYYILDIYDIFVEKVAAGRGMDKEKVEIAAQGRIYSGTRALETGLIDSIGNLSDAMRTARFLANISNYMPVTIKEYPAPKFFDRLFKSLSVTTKYNLIENFLPQQDILYRLENNGKVMPILPLEYTF